MSQIYNAYEPTYKDMLLDGIFGEVSAVRYVTVDGKSLKEYIAGNWKWYYCPTKGDLHVSWTNTKTSHYRQSEKSFTSTCNKYTKQLTEAFSMYQSTTPFVLHQKPVVSSHGNYLGLTLKVKLMVFDELPLSTLRTLNQLGEDMENYIKVNELRW